MLEPNEFTLEPFNLLEWSALLVVVYGVLLARRHFRLQALRDRFEMYQWSEAPVTKDDLSLVRALPEDYFPTPEVPKRYAKDDDALRRYISMVRRYHFLFYSNAFEAKLDDPYVIDLELWANELASTPEFKEANERFGRYYPQFSKWLRRHVKDLQESGDYRVDDSRPSV